MIARQGSAARKSKIPFGPFLAAGGVIGLWFGDDIVQWYLDEFFPTTERHGSASRNRGRRRLCWQGIHP